MDRALSGATTPGQSGPGSDGNEGVLRTSQSSSITRASPSDCLVSYGGHLLVGGGSYLSAEVQLVYSTAPSRLGNCQCVCVRPHTHTHTHTHIYIYIYHHDYDYDYDCEYTTQRLDTSLLDTQQYKVRIKGKVEQSRERSSALPNISVL